MANAEDAQKKTGDNSINIGIYLKSHISLQRDEMDASERNKVKQLYEAYTTLGESDIEHYLDEYEDALKFQPLRYTVLRMSDMKPGINLVHTLKEVALISNNMVMPPWTEYQLSMKPHSTQPEDWVTTKKFTWASKGMSHAFTYILDTKDNDIYVNYSVRPLSREEEAFIEKQLEMHSESESAAESAADDASGSSDMDLSLDHHVSISTLERLSSRIAALERVASYSKEF